MKSACFVINTSITNVCYISQMYCYLIVEQKSLSKLITGFHLRQHDLAFRSRDRAVRLSTILSIPHRLNGIHFYSSRIRKGFFVLVLCSKRCMSYKPAHLTGVVKLELQCIGN